MELELAGKVAVVTGASRGIGLAIAQALVDEGVQVIGAAREAPESGGPQERGGTFDFRTADLSSDVGAREFAESVTGPIDILVNNVGSAPARPDGFSSISDAQWLQSLSLNLLAAVRVTRAFVPKLNTGAAIVMITSENSILPDPLVMDYSAAKAAALSFTKSLSKELAPTGIRVNSVSPGPVATDLWLGSDGVAETTARATGRTPQEVRAGAEAAIPTGRFTQPREVARLVLVLVSPVFANITGADFVIDGGMRPTI
jgi:NAD(P)-dependent dehydrogenase (short-subunit alcohol dehydrogenase family)